MRVKLKEGVTKEMFLLKTFDDRTYYFFEDSRITFENVQQNSFDAEKNGGRLYVDLGHISFSYNAYAKDIWEVIDEENELVQETDAIGTTVSVNWGGEDGSASYIIKASKKDIKRLFDNYNKEYDTSEFLGSFGEYLRSKEIEFEIFKPEYDLYLSV